MHVSKCIPSTARIVLTAGLVPSLILLLGGCSNSSDGSKTNCVSGPNGGDAGHVTPDSGVPTAHDAGKRPHNDGGTHRNDGGQPLPTAPFKPSNLSTGATELGDGAAIADVVINDDCVFDTSAGELTCPGTIDEFTYAFKMVDQPGGGQAGLFIMKSLRVAQAAQVQIQGGSPAILYALETIQIDGILTGVATYSQPAGGYEQESTGHGGGPGGGEALVDYNAAGGGSYCGIGGTGGPGSSTPGSAGGKAYGNPEIIPLLAGSSGGGGPSLDASGGTGGAGLELVAGRSIDISIGGLINLGGRGGRSNGGAGGSGGALILEAPTVKVRGTLAANGGGGALFNGGSSGQPGQPTATAAQGSAATAGIGSAGKTKNGGDGSVEGTSVNSAGGGGGGAGRIRINTTSGTADITGATISPDPSTGCTTQGKVTS